VTDREELLEQLYGILDDWKAQQFGGEQIVEAIDKMRMVAATAPGTSEELRRIAEAVEGLAKAMAAQQGTTYEGPAPVPESAPQREVRENFAEIKRRMGRTPDTGGDAVEVDALPASSLSERDPVQPSPVFPDGDASIYGVGLDAVRAIRFDGSRAPIRRRGPGEVQVTVPSDISRGEVDVEVELADGTCLTGSVEVADDGPGGGYFRQQPTKGGRS
jgi:hypothetical protein